MKRKERVSKSTYRAILYVQKNRDDPSGLYVSDRFFLPEKEPEKHVFLWFAMDALLLNCLMLGLLHLAVSGFSAAVAGWLYPAVAAVCIGVVLIFRSRLCARFWPAVLMILLLAYLAVVYLNQDAFLQGMRQFAKLISYTAQITYASENIPAFPGGGGLEVSIFLLLISIPAVSWMALSLFVGNGFLMINLLIFPLLAMFSLCGAAKNTAALFLILFGVVLSMAFSRPKKQRRMWGGRNRELFSRNKLRFESVQKKTTAAVLAASIALSIPGFLLVRPILSVRLKPAEAISMNIQSDLLNRLMKLLPELSAGEWKLNLEAIGGGVQNGALNNSEGYLLEGVEDLRLTLDRKPEETLFLKGYVGKTYDSGSWVSGSGSTFDGASMNWSTEGSARIYIQNLPFLRTVFAMTDTVQDAQTAERMAGITATPCQLLVERLNANDDYTYVPYGVFLNDYYQVDSGDCAVAGQKEQEDRYFFFTRSDVEKVLNAWNQVPDTANVLDRVEESYRAFCQTDCSAYPEQLESYYVMIRNVMLENKWNAQDHLDDITAWIRRYLAENYSYALLPPEKPEDADDLRFFLDTSKAGNSVHFASAAVMFYRMFGIPARYVVGYEIPASLFTVQAGNIYTATVQGDNSQAWAEIYVPGLGWTPKDMTPGVIGTYEEIGPGGERIEAAVLDEEAETSPSETLGAEETSSAAEERIEENLPEWKNRSVGEIIRFFAGILLTLLGCIVSFLFVRHLCIALGWNFLFRYSCETRLLGVFQAFYRRMRRLGLPSDADSQKEVFAEFCKKQLRRRDPAAAERFDPTMQRLFGCSFGEESATPADICAMRSLLLASWKRPRKKK